MGDPAGVGPEVVLKSVAAFARRGDAPEFVVIGDLAAMREAAAQIDELPPLVEWHPGEALPSNGLAVLPLTELSRAARRPGQPSIEGGDASFRYVEAGARMARDGAVDALVTAPISKQWWDRAGHHFPGHSEVMAKVGRSRNWRMMFAGSELRMALVTVHVGLAQVPRLLTQKNVFDTIMLLDRHLRENEGAISPRIGVLGFNPHGGENGLFGDEELRIIAPAIKRAQKRGIDAYGPLAPDTAFVKHDGRFGFDAAVTMYHDQGLIALKTLEFDRAVNITIGLPFIRTSPDHGTAFDIAGRCVANPSSMISAIEYASHAVRAREAAGRRAA
jgi:4-hydroxythreonine-4-phosphate dehydrogenase